MKVGRLEIFVKVSRLVGQLIILLSIFFLPFNQVLADPLDALREAIKGRESDISSVNKEIQQLQIKVSEKTAERKTLQQTVSELASQQNTLEGKISNAQSSVSSLESIISEIDNEVEILRESIKRKKSALSGNLQRIQIVESDSLVEGLLKYESLSEFWQQADIAEQLGSAINESMSEIRSAREKLESQRKQQELEKARIIALQQQILIDKQSIELAKGEQNRLLGMTKNEEANFQATLGEKRKLRSAFEADMAAYESTLSRALSPAQIPVAASSSLSWPLANVVITQNFGNTAFAASGAYNGNGHNGIDLDLEVGTPVMAARDGVVKGVGNTDAQCPNASYGMWILVQHDNGLSTLYAHLSNQAVSVGQTITRGQVIGYGGNTGYSTGSHLHFTVYATPGVRVGGLPSRSCPGTTITLPLADLSAYLNPRQYLP